MSPDKFTLANSLTSNILLRILADIAGCEDAKPRPWSVLKSNESLLMSESSEVPAGATMWEHVIRAREEEVRVALLAADVQALEQLWADGDIVNSPPQQVTEKPRLIARVC
jgi:hypothetical protein